MPSAISKQPLDNGTSLSQETSIQAAIAIVEKKVRNLEKRKVGHHPDPVSRTARGYAGIRAEILLFIFQGKLDSYRDILRGGKALNEDQQSAVDKYDEVKPPDILFLRLKACLLLSPSRHAKCNI